MAKNIDNTENEQSGGKTLSGNQDVFLRLPYGLAKKHGIDTANMTPRQVWEALKGKGVDAEQEMSKLKAQLSGGNKGESESDSQPKAREYKHKDIIEKLGLKRAVHPKTKEPALLPQLSRPNEEELAYIRTHKAEIFEEVDAIAKEAKDAGNARQKKIDGIEGLSDIRETINAWEEYEYQRERDIASGRGWVTARAPSTSVEELRQRYPRAAAYLRAESFARASNYNKAGAGRRALERIIDGENYTQVLQDMEKEWSDAVRSNIWD